MIRRILVGILLAVACAGPAAAQVKQSGLVTPGHAVKWYAPGVVGDAGGAAGASAFNTSYLTELGITNTGAPLCINDALITAQGGYHQLCFGALSLGGGLISYNAYGGASPLALDFNINGATYAFPGPGNGNVVGPNASVGNDVVAFNGTSGTVIKDTGILYTNLASLNGTNTYTGSNYFGNGYPWCDVRAHGAQGDGTSNDSTAFAACVNLAASLGGAIMNVNVPPGNYCLNGIVSTGITASASGGTTLTIEEIPDGEVVTFGMVLSGAGFSGNPTIVGFESGTGGIGTYVMSSPQSFSGTLTATLNQGLYVPPGSARARVAIRGTAGNDGPQLLNCSGYNFATVEIEADNSYLSDVSVVGLNSTAASFPALWLTVNCVGCIVERSRANYGTYAILAQAQDIILRDDFPSQGEFSANVTTQGAIYIYAGKFDQPPPAGSCNISNLPTAWAINTPHAVGDCVSITSGGRHYVIQATACVSPCDTASGGSGPQPPYSYGTDVADNQVTWQLYSPWPYYGIDYDTALPGSIGESHVFKIDLSGAYSCSVAVTNSQNGTPYNYVNMTGVDASAPICLIAGSYFSITASEIGAGVVTQSTWTGPATITGNSYLMGSITALGGSGLVVTGNASQGSGAFLVLGTNVSHVTATGNSAGNSGACLLVTAGTGDYINFSHNDCSDTTGVENDATGRHNRLQDNTGYNPVGVTTGTFGTTSTSTYTAGPTAETHYLTGGTVTAVKVPAGVTSVCTGTPCAVTLGPNETFSVTYTGAPADTVSVH